MRDKWTKSRDEAAKKDEENIVVKALLKQKEVALQQALEVSFSDVYGLIFRAAGSGRGAEGAMCSPDQES